MMLAAVAASVVVAVLGASAAPAGAHAQLTSTDPANGAVLEVAPEQVVLEFSEQVDPPSDAIEIFDADGEEVSVGAIEASGTEVSAELPALEDGAYVVSWRVVSGDSHPIDGALLFYIGEAGNGEDAEALLAEVRSSGAADETLGVVYGGVRFALFAGLVLLVGGAFFVTLLWPAGAGDPRLRSIIGAGWLVVLVATVASLGLQAAYAAGGSWADTVDSGRLADVLGTRTGRTWLARLALLAVVPLAWRSLFPPWWRLPLVRGGPLSARAGEGVTPPRVPHLALILGLGGALLATVSFAGHAATGRLAAAALVLDVVHLAAGQFWLAGLGLLLVVVLRRQSPGASEGEEADEGQSARSIVTRFSPLAFGAVVVVVVTGALQGWRQVDSIDALTDSTYGRLLLTKVALFAVVLALAALSRGAVRRWADRSPARLRRSVGAEAAVAGVLIAVTAVLVNTVPARDALAAETFEAEVHGTNAAVVVTVDPAEAGPVDLAIQVLTHSGEPLAVEELSANLSLAERSINRLEVLVESEGAPGSYRAAAADIPYSGTWELEVVVRVSEVDQERLIVEVPVS